MSAKSPGSFEYGSRRPSSVSSPSTSAGAIDRTGFSREIGALEERPTDSDGLFEGSAPPRLWRDPGLLTFVGSGAVLVIGWLTALSGSRELSVAAYLVATVVGSYLFVRKAAVRLLLRRQLSLDLWVGVVIIGSVLSSEFALGAFLAFVYSITQVGVSMSVDRGLE